MSGHCKRIVLRYVTGRFAGLHQILGTTDQLRDQLKTKQLPDGVSEVDFLDGRTGAVVLVEARRRYVLYKEVVV